MESQAEVTEVLLDLVARDRRDNLVRDLKESEIEVYEDGVKQRITSFSVVEKAELKLEAPAGTATPQARHIDPLRQINLVTLVFERLDEEGRRLAQEGAQRFLNTELKNNLFAAVFVIDQRLMILQPFTNDRERLRKAIDKATTLAYSQFATDSSAIKSNLERSAAALAAGDSATSSLGRSNSNSTGVWSAFVEAALADAAARSLSYADAMAQEQHSRSSIFALLSLVRGEKNLAGRKTLLYFTQSLSVTPIMVDYLKTVISEANRANVSIYAIDARGLITGDQNKSATTMLSTATAQIRQQIQRSGGPVSRQDVMAGEQAEASIRANFQETLAALSQETGGKLIGNSNDLGVSMKRVSEDIRSYYELAYAPSNLKLDGKFREISVRVLRRGVTLQTRKGYFAVPYTEASSPFTSSELPLLGALSSSPVPHDFDYRAAALHFDRTGEGVLGSLVIEIPLSQLSFKSVPQENKFKARFSLLAFLKTPDGKVIKKFSQDYDYQGELPKLEMTKKSSILYIRHFLLPEGRYNLETVVRDADSNRISARKSIFLLPAPRTGVQMSSLSVIARIAKTSSADAQGQDPFLLSDSRLLPALGDAIESIANNGSILFYFVAYPDRSRTEKVQ
ncbi:MAG TPA: VWA domain-containing protein, partial [Acidobacteriota bacterium]|nr:VWA domain-containing protein [Acidobacteriota bacterium]